MTDTEKDVLRIRIKSKVVVDVVTGCWVWQRGFTRGGYGHLKRYRSRKQVRAHRASWLVSVGPIPDGLCVLHDCDNPPCVNPTHLFLGTMKDNVADMIAKGRKRNTYGKDPTKLNRDEQIRRLYLMGMEQSELASFYNLAQTRISQIVRNGKSRKYRRDHSQTLIVAIVDQYKRGVKQRELAELHGIAQSTISRILIRNGISVGKGYGNRLLK